MKAFDEWFEEMYKMNPDVAYQPCDGWKAALEWAIKRGYAIEETEGEYSQVLIDVLQKELESIKPSKKEV